MKGFKGDELRFIATPLPGGSEPTPGAVLPVRLHHTVANHVGDSEPGPHPVGKAETLPDGRLSLWLADTKAGRTARALLEDEIVDCYVSGSPPAVRLEVM